MRRVVAVLRFCALGIVLCAAPLAFGQETPEQTAVLDAVTRWKVINTILFVIGFGWLIARYAPRFFNARSLAIQKAIKDATGLKIDADFRYSEIDKKMATLPEATKKLRENAAEAMRRQEDTFRRQTEAELAHIQHNVAAEIDAFRSEGIRTIRKQTSDRALSIAERRLRDRFAAGEPPELVGDFVHLVQRGDTL